MLPPFIIEQIRQREEEKRRDNRPVLELPLDDLRPRNRSQGNPPGASWREERRPGGDPSRDEGDWIGERPVTPGEERGVVIIEF